MTQRTIIAVACIASATALALGGVSQWGWPLIILLFIF